MELKIIQLKRGGLFLCLLLLIPLSNWSAEAKWVEILTIDYQLHKGVLLRVNEESTTIQKELNLGTDIRKNY